MKIDNATLSLNTLHTSSSGSSHMSFQELLGREQGRKAQAQAQGPQSPPPFVARAKNSLLRITQVLMRNILARLRSQATKNGSSQDGEAGFLQNRLRQLASFRVDVQLLADREWLITPHELLLLEKVADTLAMQTPAGRIVAGDGDDDAQLEGALALIAEALAASSDSIGTRQARQLTMSKRFAKGLPPISKQAQLLNVLVDMLQERGWLADTVAEFHHRKVLPADQNFVGQMSRTVTVDRYFEKESCQFSAGGCVTTTDGKEIDFTLRMSMDREFVDSAQVVEAVQCTDPLVVNFDGAAGELSEISFNFDVDADGAEENISCLSPGSGFLAFDSNKDGVINNGSELFGPGADSGFAELSQYDGDGNHWIDENDLIFDSLLVWAKTESDDCLQSLQQAGIGALCLDNMATPFTYKDHNHSTLGNSIAAGVFLMENGAVGSLQEIQFADHGSIEKKSG